MAATEGHDIARSGASRRAAFTLVELLVVIAVITIFAGVIGFALFGGGGSTVGLQSSQSIIVGLLTQARSQAILTGQTAALLVNNNPANEDRYMRYLVVVVSDGGSWKPIDAGTYLPAGCYVVPNAAPQGTAVDAGDWEPVRSTSLRSSVSGLSVESTSAEAWIGVEFSPRGTTAEAGNVTVAAGSPNPPESTPAFVYTNIAQVRGVAVTVYGLTRLLDDRVDFSP